MLYTNCRGQDKIVVEKATPLHVPFKLLSARRCVLLDATLAEQTVGAQPTGPMLQGRKVESR
jgi:hypothetical protein